MTTEGNGNSVLCSGLGGHGPVSRLPQFFTGSGSLGGDVLVDSLTVARKCSTGSLLGLQSASILPALSVCFSPCPSSIVPAGFCLIGRSQRRRGAANGRFPAKMQRRYYASVGQDWLYDSYSVYLKDRNSQRWRQKSRAGNEVKMKLCRLSESTHDPELFRASFFPSLKAAGGAPLKYSVSFWWLDSRLSPMEAEYLCLNGVSTHGHHTVFLKLSYSSFLFSIFLHIFLFLLLHCNPGVRTAHPSLRRASQVVIRSTPCTPFLPCVRLEGPLGYCAGGLPGRAYPPPLLSTPVPHRRSPGLGGPWWPLWPLWPLWVYICLAAATFACPADYLFFKQCFFFRGIVPEGSARRTFGLEKRVW